MTSQVNDAVKSKLHIAKHAGYWVLVLLIVIMAGVAISAGVTLPGAWRVFVVESGSMSPAIPTGSLVVVHSQNTYQKGAVITFLSQEYASARNSHMTITHRIVDVTDNTFTTKGDANNAQDPEKVPAKQVLGAVKFHIPYIGYPIAYAKTQTGFIILIVIPATIIIYSEAVAMKQGIAAKMAARKARKETV